MALLGVTVWRSALGVDRARVIEEVDFDEESGFLLFHVRPGRSTKRRCGRCGVRALVAYIWAIHLCRHRKQA